MENVAHWTQRDIAHFVYNISSNFMAQLEAKMEKDEITRTGLANRLKKTNGRISQVFNNPGNLSLRVIAELARTLGMKVSIVAYDDKDPGNQKGPIDPDVFVKCWEMANRPTNLFEVQQTNAWATLTEVFYCANPYQGFRYNENPCSETLSAFYVESLTKYVTPENWSEDLFFKGSKIDGPIKQTEVPEIAGTLNSQEILEWTSPSEEKAA